MGNIHGKEDSWLFSANLKSMIEWRKSTDEDELDYIFSEWSYSRGWLFGFGLNNVCVWDGINLVVEFSKRKWRKYGNGVLLCRGKRENTLKLSLNHKGKLEVVDISEDDLLKHS